MERLPLIVSLALIAYGSRSLTRGPAYVGAIGLGSFIAPSPSTQAGAAAPLQAGQPGSLLDQWRQQPPPGAGPPPQ